MIDRSQYEELKHTESVIKMIEEKLIDVNGVDDLDFFATVDGRRINFNLAESKYLTTCWAAKLKDELRSAREHFNEFVKPA